MNWKNNFIEGKQIILATSSKKWIPNANIVISLGFIDNKLLVADCQMNNTIKNLIENKKICVIWWTFRIKWKVEIFSSWKYYDICIKNNKDYQVKNAIVISIDEIFDLDKVKLIEYKKS